VKRRLFKLVLFLLLGAIVNIAVAWGCTAWNPLKVYFGKDKLVGTLASGQYSWNVARIKVFGATMLYSVRTWKKDRKLPDIDTSPEMLLPSWSNLGEESDEFKNIIARDPESEIIEQRMIYFTGWPTRSMWSHSYVIDPGDSPTFSVGDHYLFQLDSWGTTVPRALPIRPIWPGFAINTIFYAALLWLLTFGPFTARRMIRRKRGLCVKCAYDLRGHSGGNSGGEVCPECGWGRAGTRLIANTK